MNTAIYCIILPFTAITAYYCHYFSCVPNTFPPQSRWLLQLLQQCCQLMCFFITFHCFPFVVHYINYSYYFSSLRYYLSHLIAITSSFHHFFLKSTKNAVPAEIIGSDSNSKIKAMRFEAWRTRFWSLKNLVKKKKLGEITLNKKWIKS